MATLLKQKGSKNWYVVFRKKLDPPVGRKRSRVVWLATGTDDEEQARELLRQVEAMQNERTRRDALARAVAIVGGDAPVAARVRLAELPEFYRRVADLPPDEGRAAGRPSQARLRLNMLAGFLDWVGRAHPEAVYLNEIGPRIAAEFWRWMAEDGRSPRTRNNYLSQLNVAWRTMGAEAGLSTNPWAMIRRDQAGGTRFEDLSREQVGRLLWEADHFAESRLDGGFWSGAIRLAYHTGLREGDVATFEVAEIRRERNCVIIQPNKGKRWGNRAQVVHPLDAPWLEWVPQPEKGMVWPLAAAAYAAGRGHVFTDEWRDLCARAGIATERAPAPGERRKRAVKLATFHSLRHTFVTQALAAGADKDDIRKTAGHSTIAMTEHYDHTPALAAATRVAAAMPTPRPIPPDEGVAE